MGMKLYVQYSWLVVGSGYVPLILTYQHRNVNEEPSLQTVMKYNPHFKANTVLISTMKNECYLHKNPYVIKAFPGKFYTAGFSLDSPLLVTYKRKLQRGVWQ